MNSAHWATKTKMHTDRNLLITGDNLPVLRALEKGFSERIQCVYLDPPYNTGAVSRAAQESAGYVDKMDSKSWLESMHLRLKSIHKLLAETGSVFIQLDENEMDYLKVELDTIFGKENFVNRIVINARSPSSFSTVNKGLFKASEYVLWYAKNKGKLKVFPLRVARKPDQAYRLWLSNPDDPPESWRITKLREAHPTMDLDQIRIQYAHRVCRLAPISDKKAGKAIVQVKADSRQEPERVFVVQRDDHADQYVLRGNQLIFYDKQVQMLDGTRSATQPLTNIWTDIAWEGIAKEGGVVYKTGKKPERLLRRILQLCTEEGDWVLDAFLGSGSTAAVAQKMGRRWVGIEQGEAWRLAKKRLRDVCNGDDPTGISSIEDWKGSGDFMHYVWDDGFCLPE